MKERNKEKYEELQDERLDYEDIRRKKKMNKDSKRRIEKRNEKEYNDSED